MCNAKRMQAKTWRPAGFRSSAACSPVGETAVLTLLVSVAIAVVGIIVVFFVLSLVSLDKSIAGTAATAIIGGIPYLRDSLDKGTSAKASCNDRNTMFAGWIGAHGLGDEAADTGDGGV